MNNHEIDFEVHGDDMQYVKVELDPQETVIAEAGGLMMMDEQIRMETIFGGEGFIMQKLEGDGMTFVHTGGTMHKRVLEPGETLKVDTGCLVAMTGDVDYNIEFIGGVKTALFGGEGLFFATLRGPGVVWIQSLPFSRLASRVSAAAPEKGGSKGEGSITGGLYDILGGK